MSIPTAIWITLALLSAFALGIAAFAVYSKKFLRKPSPSTKASIPNANHPLSHAFQLSPVAHLLIDPRGRIRAANRAALHIFGRSGRELHQQPLSEFIQSEDEEFNEGLVQIAAGSDTETASLECKLMPLAREPLPVKLSLRKISKNIQAGTFVAIEDNSEASSLSELVAFHSQYDELTLLHNRTGLEKYLNQVMAISAENRSQVALFYIDVDQLKVVNDTCGHGAGDRLLQYLVSLMSDAAPSCNFFARLGGDEFALVKLQSDENDARNIAEALRSAAEDFSFVWEQHRYRQSISVGVALSSEKLSTVVDLLGAADSACYTAKQAGKNRVVVYSEKLEKSQDNRREMQWVSRLQSAIQSGNFILYFHPIQKLASSSRSHVHYELLIRYIDEKGRHVLPQHFLPAVERFGLSEQIDLWVLTTALDFLDRHPEHTEMLDCCSINLTSQSIANPRIRSAILQVMESYPAYCKKVCFEITESSALHNLIEAREFVSELRALGCKIALDDFGTGFSSFGYLKHLEVDYIKIDGSFVRDLLSDRFDRAMVGAIANIGRDMGMEIIAEYAETTSIVKALRSMDIDYAQGHAIATALPIDELEAFYEIERAS